MKIGLFFGSFNPVHIGHMAIANYMAEFTSLDRVWMVVSPHNPHKEKNSLLDDRHRLRLVREAIGDHKKLKASDIEFKLAQPSYTVNTLAHLKEKHPKDEFSLIMGHDNLLGFHKWKNHEEILAHHDIYVYPRLRKANEISSPLEKHPKVKMTDAPLMEISASFIREAIRSKKDVRHFLPQSVWEYIGEMNFYKK